VSEDTSPETTSKRERTRQAIMDAAYSLIIEQGYAATSMRQIAERSGLALGGIYNHFPSKSDVFSNIILERHPIFHILPLLDSVEGQTVEEFVRTAARLLVDELKRHPDFLNLLLIEVVEFKGAHAPLLIEKVVPLLAPLGEHVTQLQGEVRPIPIKVVIRAFFGMFFSYYITGILGNSVMPPEMQTNSLEYFLEIFLHGILVEKGE
jgi:AcrR family transcriptional regulator